MVSSSNTDNELAYWRSLAGGNLALNTAKYRGLGALGAVKKTLADREKEILQLRLGLSDAQASKLSIPDMRRQWYLTVLGGNGKGLTESDLERTFWGTTGYGPMGPAVPAVAKGSSGAALANHVLPTYNFVTAPTTRRMLMIAVGTSSQNVAVSAANTLINGTAIGTGLTYGGYVDNSRRIGKDSSVFFFYQEVPTGASCTIQLGFASAVGDLSWIATDRDVGVLNYLQDKSVETDNTLQTLEFSFAPNQLGVMVTQDATSAGTPSSPQYGMFETQDTNLHRLGMAIKLVDNNVDMVGTVDWSGVTTAAKLWSNFIGFYR